MFAPIRVAVAWICLISLITQLGCATKTPHLPVDVRSRLGVVAIVPAKNQPEVDLNMPAKGPLAGAGRKSARWAGMGLGIGAATGFSLPKGCEKDRSGIVCGGLIAVAAAVAAIGLVVGGTVGSVVGAVQAEPAKDIQQAEEVILSSIASQDIQMDLCSLVAEVALGQARNEIIVVQDQFPAVRDNENPFASLVGRNIDTVLEIAIPRIALDGDWDINPPLQFQMDSHIRLVRTIDGNMIYESSSTYKGSTNNYNEWSTDNALLFNEQLDEASENIANWIVNEVFPRNLMPTQVIPDDYHDQ